MQGLYLFITVAAAFLSWGLQVWRRKALLSALVPLAIVGAYFSWKPDEFAFWAVGLAFGLVCCGMGCALGIFVAKCGRK